MSVVHLIWSNLMYKKLSSFLTIVLFTCGLGLMLLMVQLDDQVEKSFKKNIKGIHLVLGAKGSPLQLILSSVYHTDYPTGNVPVSEVKKWSKYPSVTKAIPLSYGDSYKGYRLVGTTLDYPNHYGAELAEGAYWSDHLEVVAGAKVVQALGLKIGDSFSSTHGFDDETGHVHEKSKFKIVGILKPTGTIVDQLLLCDVPSIWVIHDSDLKKYGNWTDYSDKTITSLLLQFKNRLSPMMLVRKINEQTKMQAALPVYELDRLLSLVGNAYDVLNILSGLIIVLSGLSIFVSLWNRLEERKKDIALLRVMGAKASFVLRLIIMEGISIALLSFAIGWLLSRLMLVLISHLNEKSIYSFEWLTWHPLEIKIFGLAIGLGIVAALFPAIRVYKMAIAKVLRDE